MSHVKEEVYSKRRPMRYEFCEWGVVLKERLPPGVKSWCVDVFFRYMPIFVIRVLWKELDGYLKLKTPRHGDVVVDAGAWTGHFSVIAARLVGRKGRVIAIEPQKTMCNRLNSRLKRLGFRTVTVVNAALFDRSCDLSVCDTGSSAFTVLDEAKDTDNSTVVNLRTLDEILATLGVNAVDFIKMDIEGAEIEALSGMSRTLSLARPFLAIASYHWREGAATCGRVEDILSSYGYSASTGHHWHLTTWGFPC